MTTPNDKEDIRKLRMNKKNKRKKNFNQLHINFRTTGTHKSIKKNRVLNRNYLFKLFGDQRERLVDGGCGSGNGNDALRTRAVGYVDDGARLVACAR